MKVVIREKKTSENKASLYLDIHVNGNRKKEYLKKHIYPGSKNANENRHNREVMEFAERVRAKRIVEIENGIYGLPKSRV